MTRFCGPNVVVSRANLVDDRAGIRPTFRPHLVAQALLFHLKRESLLR
jgi:hypothetical protein